MIDVITLLDDDRGCVCTWESLSSNWILEHIFVNRLLRIYVHACHVMLMHHTWWFDMPIESESEDHNS